MIAATDFAPPAIAPPNGIGPGQNGAAVLGRLVTLAELDGSNDAATQVRARGGRAARSSPRAFPVVGITGTGGAGKSSFIDELVRRFLLDFAKKTVAVVSVDPTKRKTGGALLGDRIRMNAINDPRVFMRSLATRASGTSLSAAVSEAVALLKAAGPRPDPGRDVGHRAGRVVDRRRRGRRAST